MLQVPNLGVTIGVFALLPAICEEFAFRGFILSGLEHQHRTRSAILLSALMFGFLHVLLSLFPAALQRDAAGHRARVARGAQPEHRARAHFPLPEQRHRSLAGLLREGCLGTEPSSLGSIATRTKGFIMWLGQSASALLSAVLAVLPVEAEVRSEASDTLTLKARYVLPVEGPPIEDGSLDDRPRADRLGRPFAASVRAIWTWETSRSYLAL